MRGGHAGALAAALLLTGCADDRTAAAEGQARADAEARQAAMGTDVRQAVTGTEARHAPADTEARQAAADTAARHAPAGTEARAVAGKPVGPIVLDHELLDTPHVGQPLRIRVTAVPRRDVEALTIEARGSAALVQGALPVEPPVTVAAGESVTRIFTVYPMEEGRHTVDIVAEGLVAGEPQAGGLTIAVRVGSAVQGAAGIDGAAAAERPAGTDGAVAAERPPARTDAAGQRLRSLPAEER